MKQFRTIGGLALIFALVAVIGLYANHAARGSDHQDSPATIGRPGADITDPYIFPSPNNPGNVVVVMEMHPLIPSGQGPSTFFDPGVVYQMNFDTASENGGTFPASSVTQNEVIQLVAGPPGPNQPIYIYGPGKPSTTGNTTNLLPLTGSGTIGNAFTVNGMQVFAGPREDAFFFDLAQFLKILPDRNAGSTATSCLPVALGGDNSCPQGFNSTGSDTLKGFNVLSFIIELPRTMLQTGGGSKIAYWATTNTSSGN
ncbi:MAG: DUF4331 domain-containing protein [Candidatus Eremiobacteraeota bacterium]|nr:DUF4331 domain-containing protein [Candidatus Eremiobacteraeota bacterium]